jgi:aminomethyltransferase
VGGAMMMRTTPFYPRLSELNQTGLYGHWAGYLSALRYDLSAKHEYFAVRNSAGFFDTSPLYKYRITGPDSQRFLAGVMTRDVRRCRPGQAFYTVWCDDAGFVLEDGVLFRHAEDDWMLTAADPNLGYLDSLIGRLRVSIEDVSADYGALAVQGPRSRAILATLAPEVNDLAYFGLTPAKIGGAPVTISRTGYTGDLGFEVFVESDDALAVLDKIIQAGDGQGFRPFGEDALLMLRIEAGLALINVEFSSARYAFTDAERFTPKELGFGWMLGKDGAALGDDRPFVGRRAIERELREGTSRWATVGLWVDWQEFERLYLERGLVVPKDENPVPWESMLYGGAERDERVGYATSLMYSPVLQRHIGMARVLPEYAATGSTVHLEITVDHEYLTVPATTDRMPLYNPARKTGSSVDLAPISYRMEQ